MKHLLRRSILFASGIATMSAFGLWAGSTGSAPAPQTVATNEPLQEDNVVLYGSLEQSQNDSWQAVQQYGVHRLPFTDEAPVPEGPLTTTRTTGGGFYFDGAYYCLSGTSNSKGVVNTWIKYDTDTWERLASFTYSTPTLTDALALAYDYTTGTAYAIGCNWPESVNPTSIENAYYLRTINLENGEMTNVGSLDQKFPAMAIDSDGQIWGLARNNSFPHDVSLYKIDKNTGATTFVGATGYNQKSNYAAACFDHRNGKLYWTTRTFTYDSFYQETYQSVLCEIDLNTGKAKLVRNLDYEEVFSSLYIKDAHPKAPEAIKNPAFNYKPDNNTQGNVSFTLPTAAYDRTTLSGSLKAVIYLDGKQVDTADNLTPGNAFTSKDITLAEGKHTIKVYCYTQGGLKSLPGYISAYGGADLPASVTNINVEANPYQDKATITWAAPTQGVNGGALDPAELTYKVVRRPERKVIAEGLTECTFTDNLDRVQYLTQYEVYAVTSSGESAPSYSSSMLLGTTRTMPYVETFDSQRAFNSFTVLDPNGIASPNGDTWMWHPDFQNAIYWLNYDAYNSVNAWLVTPSLALHDGYVYRLTWQTKGYSTEPAQSKFEVNVGEFPTEESLDRRVLTQDFRLEKNDILNFNTLFTAEANDRHIGFHIISDGKDHISIDNLRLVEYGPANIPAAPELISIIEENDQVKITVKLPTLDVAGNPVSKITRLRLTTADMRRLITITDVDGTQSTATIVDPAPTFGVNDYAIMAVNEYGSGLDLTASINTKPDVPKPVENFTLSTASDGHDAVLSWSYPEDMLGVDGNKLSEDEITYDIYASSVSSTEPIASLTGEYSIVIPDVMAPFPLDRQKYITYTVVARTAGGEAARVERTALFGAAYELPIHENFSLDESMRPWDGSRSTSASFSAMSNTGYDPRCTATEGNVLSFMPSSNSALGIYVSPRINLTGVRNPKMKFSVYQDPMEALANASVQIGILAEKDGIEQQIELIPGLYKLHGEAGWVTYEVDLKAYTACDRASLVLRCITGNRQARINFDIIDVTGDKHEYDARVRNISGPVTAVMGRDNNYTVIVDNNGINDLENVKVTLMADDEAVSSQQVTMAEGEQLALNFTYTPGLDETARPVKLYAVVEAENDQNRYNDRSEKHINVEAPNLPYVTDLSAVGTPDGYVQLTWGDAVEYPNEETASEDFENYTDFTIEDFGDWKMHDLDGATTMLGISSSMGTYTWENVGKPQAYIIFNPETVGVTQLATAHSGASCLVSFDSASDNNDWLVSPALSTREQTISFWAKGMLAEQYPEVFSIMISRSGTDPEDFTPLEENRTVAHSDWKKYSYTLPSGTRHFAIVCKSTDGFGFMLDDFEYTPAQPEVELTGYNVYRDYTLLTEGLSETEHLDTTNDPDVTHRYHVTATYTDGESIFSNPVDIQASSVGMVTGNKTVIYSTAGNIIVNAPAGSPISVYTLEGRCLYSFTSTGTESMRVAPGIYIVKAGTTSAKLIVR